MQEVKKYVPKRFILSYHARRKNYRRKIAYRAETESDAYMYWLMHYNHNYDYEIYTYDWQLVKVLTIDMLRKENS